MPVSTFPNGFTNGITIRGLPITTAHPGKVFFVNNSAVLAIGGIAGSDFGPGSYRMPFQTLGGAIGTAKVVASRGDIIMIMPGHAETISTATALTLATSGVAIVGLGTGSLRPTFTLDTATTATINVTGSNISITNCLFVANFAAIAALFSLTTADNFTLSECEFRDTSSILNFVNIVVTDATSTHAKGLYISKCNMYGLGATTNTTMVNVLGTNDRITVKDCYVAHAAVTGGGFMQIASGKVITNAIISGNTANLTGATSLTTGTMLITQTANTGVVANNFVHSLDDTSMILATASSGFVFMNNFYAAVADTSGLLLPAVGT